MDAASTVSGEYLLVTPAKFLVDAGITPKQWNQRMLGSTHHRVIKYYDDSSNLFTSGVAVAGGIVITQYNTLAEYTPIGKFTASNESERIVDMVTGSDGYMGLDTVIRIPAKFNLQELYAEHPELASRISSHGRDKLIRTNYFDRFPEIFPTVKPVDGCEYVGIYGASKHNTARTSGAYRYVKKKYIAADDSMGMGSLTCYKVLIPEAWNRGEPIEARPYETYTQTYYSIGNPSAEANHNCRKYLMTDFVWFMLRTLKKTQHNSIRTWRNVPVQDFTENSDIDWSRTIPEIDKQLYKKYHLPESSVQYIREHM